ncbi:hypothetical protein H0H93_003035 [Arthromyces matolae]|nr:hypothetical protein H0H93_003035 [Arthromyces matolae]
MLERFLPQETQDHPSATAKAAGAPKSTSNPTSEVFSIGPDMKRIKATSGGTGAWPRDVGVQRVTWNSCNGLAACALLALRRVDELWGRWIKGKVPYGGIENICSEVDDDMMHVDVVSDDSAGSS